MTHVSNTARFLALISAVALAGACSRTDQSTSEAGGASASARTGAAANEKYPEPRWPSYFKPPSSVDDLMPAAPSSPRGRCLAGTAWVGLPPPDSAGVAAAVALGGGSPGNSLA